MSHGPRRPSATELAEPMAARGLIPEHHQVFTRSSASPVRAIAEWEPMGGVLLGYPGSAQAPIGHLQVAPSGPREFGIPDELIVRLQQGGRVHLFVLCHDDDAVAEIAPGLSACAEQLSLPFDADLVHVVPWNPDTYWTRDYGPWWVHCTNDDTLGIARHVYTSLGSGSVGWVEGNEDLVDNARGGIFRLNDNGACDAVSDFLGSPVRRWNLAGRPPTLEPHHYYFTGLLDAGGNYMVTGDGILASSYLVARQNEMPGNDTIDERMHHIADLASRFLGITRYLVFTDPSGTYIGHIDCWAKFLGPRLVLVAHSADPNVDRAYDDIARVFEGEGFHVHRVLCPPITARGSPTTAAYCNSLILNDCVYVPIAGGEHGGADEAALAVYRAALPDHQVFGMLGKPHAPWFGTDALHCRTQGVPAAAVENWLAATAPST